MLRVQWKSSGCFVLVPTIAIFLFATFQTCKAQNVDQRDFTETCGANFITQDYDRDWEDAHEDAEWKVRMASKLHIYLLAHSMYRATSFKEFHEDHFKKACFHTDRINGWSVTNTTGFGGRSVLMRLARTDVPRVYRFILPYGPAGSTQGTASIILSDNDLYTVFEFCFDNGLRTFAVFSRNQINDHRDAIKLHLRSIGFKEEHFVDLRPNNCEENPDPKDLPKGVAIIFYPGPVVYRGPGGPERAYPPPPVFHLASRGKK